MTISRILIVFLFLHILAPFLVAQDGNEEARQKKDHAASSRLPNFIIIFCDDMGYAHSASVKSR